MFFLKKTYGQTIIRKCFYEKFFSFRPSLIIFPKIFPDGYSTRFSKSYISCYICSKLLMIPFLNQWCLLKAVFFWKTILSFNFILNYYITISFQDTSKTLNQFIYLSRTKNIWKTVCLFHLSNWTNQNIV